MVAQPNVEETVQISHPSSNAHKASSPGVTEKLVTETKKRVIGVVRRYGRDVSSPLLDVAGASTRSKSALFVYINAR